MDIKKLWKNFSQTFLKGALLLLPLFLSFYFLIWLADVFDGLFSQFFLPFSSNNEIPFGLGLLSGIIFIYIIGLSSEFFIAQFLKEWIEKIIKKIPILGSLFGSLKDVFDYLKPQANKAHGKAVIVTFQNPDFKIAGFLTRNELQSLPTNDKMDGLVAVYIPLAYMVGGGFTVFVKKENVKELQMSFEKAMQANLTAWMIRGEKNEKN